MAKLPRGFKLYNQYQESLGSDYEKTPKAVYAAIALSFAVMLDGEENFDRARAMIKDEWEVLHQAGIVPNKPK